MRCGLLLRFWLLAGSLAWSGLALGQTLSLKASVDRDTIRSNESFTYFLRAEGPLSGRPDLSALARDFDVLETSQSTRLELLGSGRTSQIGEWRVALMPRRPGRFELPPIMLNGVQSNAVAIEILPAPDASDSGDIFMEVEIDRPVSYVQAQTIYTLRLFVGIGTGRATLTTPEVAGGEAIVEKLGDDIEYQIQRDDRVYHVRERKYAIFAQTPGRLSIGPAVYDAVVFPTRNVQRQYRLSSSVVELEVRPAVAPPATHPEAVWLPATGLRIEEAWGDSSAPFEQGVPKTRALTVVASGVLETQLPEFAPAETPGLRQYADQPEFGREDTAAGFEARRTERFAVIAQQAGSLELPPLELPWFNVATERWEVARLDAVTIDVLPGTAPLPAPAAATASSLSAPASGSVIWPWLSSVLGVGWLATAVAWWLRARPGRERGARTVTGQSPSTRTLLRQLTAACRVNDARRTQELLLAWARLQFGDDPPGSLGALASRLSGPLAAEIQGLEAALYGVRTGDWRGAALLDALKAAPPLARSRAADDSDPLAPLYR